MFAVTLATRTRLQYPRMCKELEAESRSAGSRQKQRARKSWAAGGSDREPAGSSRRSRCGTGGLEVVEVGPRVLPVAISMIVAPTLHVRPTPCAGLADHLGAIHGIEPVMRCSDSSEAVRMPSSCFEHPKPASSRCRGRDKHVCALDIAMDDATFVQVLARRREERQSGCAPSQSA